VEAVGRIGRDEPKLVTLAAVDLYVKDATTRGVRASRVPFPGRLLEGDHVSWREREGLRLLHQITLKHIIAYRASWNRLPR